MRGTTVDRCSDKSFFLVAKGHLVTAFWHFSPIERLYIKSSIDDLELNVVIRMFCISTTCCTIRDTEEKKIYKKMKTTILELLVLS